MNKNKKNFRQLVEILKRYCLDSNKYVKETYFSEKYNSFISYGHSLLSTHNVPGFNDTILGKEYVDKYKNMGNRLITYEEFVGFCKQYKKENPTLVEKAEHKFRLFIYLEENNFCLDVEENGVRTKLVEVKMPVIIIVDHNGETALKFEKLIKDQIKTYLTQKQTNIEIARKI